MSIANNARRKLIQIGKQLPFILCFVLLVHYIETTYCLLTTNYIYFYDCTIVNAPMSFYISKYFEYDWMFVFVATIISFAVETCKWNKIAILYLALHLWLKSYLDFELEISTIYTITILNIAISGYLVFKGIKQILK